MNKQKEYLEKVYSELVKNTKWRDASYRDIDLYDGKCKSLQVGIKWSTNPPSFSYIPVCLQNYLTDTWGLTYEEMKELFWGRYDKHVINMKLIRHQPYNLIESKEDKQKEYLDKIVSKMVDETVPYSEVGAGVVTPFIADKFSNLKWILSAHYCNRMVDDFEYEFTPGKIFTDYLDVYGLSFNEMWEVMRMYFKQIFDKYFRKFFDKSYKTKPRLDEGVDLGFVDKVADRVLKEIVWDFDRGFVYFPMIDYSANIRDDDFLAPLMSDDPFSIHFRERNETSWHDDLMKHVEDIYGITGNEWNRVWGSLQGELWDKHVDWWNTFTSGY